MPPTERTRDIYEEIAAYPKPAVVPVPVPGDLTGLEAMNVTLSPAARRIVRAAMAVTGFNRFWRQLPERVEGLLRRTNLRGPGLFAPVISATLAFQDDPRRLDGLTRAATLVAGARQFHEDLMSGRLAPDQVNGRPAEMGQYPNFFSTNIIFEDGRPRLFKSTMISRIAVLARGRAYVLDIGDIGVRDSPGRLRARLAGIWNAACAEPAPAAERAPGVITAADHMFQVGVVPGLTRTGENSESFAQLQHCFLTVCLDLESEPADAAGTAKLAHSTNLENRWHYSSLQLAVFGNGKAAAICSFSAYLDGNTMMRGAAEIWRRAAECRVDSAEQVDAQAAPLAPLRWQISAETFEAARKTLIPMLDSQQATFELEGFGATFFQARGLDPVPAFAAVLQVMAGRWIAEPVRITQFLSLSRYRCMDLVTAMVSTPEVMAFAEAMRAAGDTQPEGALELLRAAIESQVRVCRVARQAIDMDSMFSLFLASGGAVARRWRAAVGLAAGAWLRALGLWRPKRREILISHPGIYPEVPVVGRPGVRLPYCKYFGLHYQIWPDRTVITWMPSDAWKIPNAELTAELQDALERVSRVAARYGSAAG